MTATAAPRIEHGPPASPREAARDTALTADVVDALVNDARTAHLELEVAAHGGVVHAGGEVGSTAERELVRRLIRRVAGVQAAWDLLRMPGEELRIADVGCGETKQVHEAIGVDVVPQRGVDVVADLESRLPFEDGSLDHVFAVHVLEHLRDLLGTMRELHRVLRAGGLLHVLVPDWRHVNAVADPTHVRSFDVRTLEYFCSRRPGVAPWRPLIATVRGATVHADLSPVKEGEPEASREHLARWFA